MDSAPKEPFEISTEEDAQEVGQVIGSLHGNAELLADPTMHAISCHDVVCSHERYVPGRLWGLGIAAGVFEQQWFQSVLRTGARSDRTYRYHFLDLWEANG
jgi:hypothetical protein